jgi:DNA-binding MarR family transcriptional regulator
VSKHYTKNLDVEIHSCDVDEIDRLVAEWKRVRPDLDTSPAHTLTRITRLALLQAASFAPVFGRYGLTWGEYLVLAALRRAGRPFRMTPTKLFSSLLLSSGAMTNRLDRLEEIGLVRRLPDPSDRRGRLVELTAKARRLVDKAVVDHLTDEEQLVAPLSRSEQARLAGLLRKLLLSEPFLALDRAQVVEAPPRRGRRRPRPD